MSKEYTSVKAAHDEIAVEYAAEVETNPYYVDLDMSATTGLVPGVQGQQILDAGCGTGLYTGWLLEHGADVVGVDVSERMLTQARTEYESEAEFHHADIEWRLDFAEAGEFDGIVSGLALGHIADLGQTFSEFARILKPGGFLVFSIGHPFNEVSIADERSYFEVERCTEEWAGETLYYSRPISEILNSLSDTGFLLDRVVEPRPTHAFAEHEDLYEKEACKPVFLAVRAYYSLHPGTIKEFGDAP